MAIKITSDSTCDLGSYAQKYQIGVVPLNVHLDMETYLDGVNITPQDIFRYVEETKQLPKTSAKSQEDYEEFFKEQLVGAEGVLHVSISDKASVSHKVAKTAAETFGGKVKVVDSKALSTGQGLLVVKAAELRDQGKSIEEIEKELIRLRDKVNTSFVPDRLDYLYKGGRCSRMAMYGANLLGIHPLIEMHEGQLGAGGKYKGRMAGCIKRYVEYLKEKYPEYDKSRCFITHSSADPELVEVAREKVKECFEFEEILETVAGSVITGHCGKGTLGVLFIAK
ncbi:MAG: DegV family protein [Clostridia bacterium]|nr:DegV family protein [Clostridia bacterium]